MIEIVKYSPELKKIWNEFVESSKNGTFLFNRNYMDYHSDRFIDNSYLIYRKGKLYCLLPANRKDDTFYSHQGLTYGGLIMNEKCTAEGILEAFQLIIEELKISGIRKLIYKAVPHIYHTLPSEEDLYALFRMNAQLKVRNISSTIRLSEPLRLNKDRREAVRRAERKGLVVKQSADFEGFWKILKENLNGKYGAKPVHSVDEIFKLKSLFPDQIKLWVSGLEPANPEEDIIMMAGVVCYYTKTTLHAQYISATPEGKKMGAVDLIISKLIEKEKLEGELNCFDLGTSNEDGGYYLNESLIYQKQGFGGRAICYDTYELNL